MSTRKRIREALQAVFFGFGARIALQFAQIPLLLSFWTVDQVGVWTLLTLVPTYILILSTGLALAGGSAEALSHNEDKLASESAIYQAGLLMAVGSVSIVYALGCILLSTGAFFSPDYVFLAQGITLPILFLYCVCSAFTTISLIAFRFNRKYPLQTYIESATPLLEFIAIWISLVIDPRIESAIMAITTVKILACVIYVRIQRAYSPHLFKRPSPRALHLYATELIRPALGHSVTPFVQFLNVGAVSLIAANSYGPSAFLALNLTRMIAKLPEQLANLTFNPLTFESTYLLASAKRTLLPKIAVSVSLILMSTTTLYILTVILLGGALFAEWTKEKLVLDYALFLVLCLPVVVRCITVPLSAIVSAANESLDLNLWMLGGSIAAISVASAALNSPFGDSITLLHLSWAPVVAELFALRGYWLVSKVMDLPLTALLRELLHPVQCVTNTVAMWRGTK